ncbi:MAG: hypothetical protein QOH25_1668 [Acidobacteriota bacterium]|jgi:CheY-like chemotaxis protein|nr:hypothetical protein [Acidobacteriota bacterium]
MLEASCGRARVLVVDDEPDIRDILCDLLSFDYPGGWDFYSQGRECYSRGRNQDSVTLANNPCERAGCAGVEAFGHTA